VALVFEDVQWADPGLLDFIEQLLDWSSSSPIFILTLARPELTAGRDAWPAGHRGATLVRLEPLGETAMRKLLADLVDALPALTADQIVARAQGVPLYAIETIRALADRGVLSEQDGRLVPIGEVGELDVPASLSSLLSARLDSLSVQERGLVKAMSVFGRSFPRSAAAGLGDVPEAQLDSVLASLVRKGVLVIRTDRLSPDRGQYAFAQELLRTVAYDMLSRQERKPRHIAAAEHLRSAFPDEGEDVAEVIANHYLDALAAAAGDPDEGALREHTLEALRRAGRRAVTVGAPETAERIYRNAIELARDDRERADLTQAAGEMAFQAGRLQEAFELLEGARQALAALGAVRDSARVAANLARTLIRLGRIEEARTRVSAALDQLGDVGLDPVAAVLHEQLARANFFAGSYTEAIAHTESALELAQALTLTDVLCGALVQKANACLYTGRVEEARILYLGARELAERDHLVDQLATMGGNFSNLCLMWDRPEAVTEAQTTLTLTRRRGERYSEAISAGNLVSMLILKGRWTEGEEVITDLLGDGEDLPGRNFLRYRAAHLAMLRGDLTAARGWVEHLTEWAQSDDEELQSMVGVAQANLLASSGDAARALEQHRELFSRYLHKLSPASEVVRDGWPLALESARQLQQVEAVRELVDLLAAEAPGHIPPYLDAQLARGRAAVGVLSGDHESVETALSRAIERLGELAYPYWLAIAEIDLAEWLIGQGRTGEADPLLEEAANSLRALGAQPALERIERLGRPERSAV
jgi:tetratricopeptide (TPR) repeat protein